MANLSTYQNSKRPNVAIFSDPNFLAVGILEGLLAMLCSVMIFTDDVSSWQAATKHIRNRNLLEILSTGEFLNKNIRFAYCFCIFGFINPSEIKKKIEMVVDAAFFSTSKVLLVLPAEKAHLNLKLSKSLRGGNVGLVFLGDLLGARIDIKSLLLFPSILRGLLLRGVFEADEDAVFYPLFVFDAVKKLTRWLFSFGPYGRRTFLLGNAVSANGIYGELRRYYPNLPFSPLQSIGRKPLSGEIDKMILPADIYLLLKETLEWLKENPQDMERVGKKEATRKIKTPRTVRARGYFSKTFKNKRVFGALLMLFVLMVFPFLMLALGSLAAFGSYKSFLSGNLKMSSSYAKVGRSVANAAKLESQFFETIPGIGAIYKESATDANMLLVATDTSLKAMSLVSTGTSLLSKILGEEVYGILPYTEKIALDLDEIYRQVSFLQGEFESSIIYSKYLSSRVKKSVNIERLKKIVLHGQAAVKTLPEVLGVGSKKTYLVLFQNNMELRPTGGFIGSFGLVTFDEGKISEVGVSDVYSADGQLKGHVEPPEPIRKYLGEANWYLRDSNWDPDFSVSAQRAEWFLEKELDKQVDGVVGVDLQFAKLLLKQLGPVYLGDFDITLDTDNLYEKTQNEVEDNFFPGSHKKTNFLTSLARQILSDLPGTDTKAKLGVLRAVETSLEQRHFQIFVHDSSFQSAVSSLGWGGEVPSHKCGDSCYSDLVGTVEANVGVNKANYYIERSSSLDVYFEPQGFRKVYTLNFTNNANPALGGGGRYKVYTRLLASPDSSVLGVEEVAEGRKQELPFEVSAVRGRVEVGVIDEILAGQRKKIVFTWTSGGAYATSTDGGYGLYIRKQAGVGGYPLKITLHPPFGNKTVGGPAFVLTQGGAYVYNTVLARDVSSRVLW